MKKIISAIIYLLIIPAIIYIGIVLYNKKLYNLISLLVVVVALVPFFISFEKRKIKLEKIVLIAAFTAITSLSRIIFNLASFLPGFNPVTAIIILIGISFGKDTGFMVGALTALVSNNYISHGPWTPFQMFSWGIIGYFSGVFSKLLKKNKLSLLLFGMISGVLFSILMDIYTVLSYDNAFTFKRFFVLAGLSIPFTITYVVANLLFLLLFSYLFLVRMERIIQKYEIK